jgi:hypothetical protein
MKYALGKMLECRTSKLLTNLEKLVWMLRVIPTWTNVATLVNLRKNHVQIWLLDSLNCFRLMRNIERFCTGIYWRIMAD